MSFKNLVVWLSIKVVVVVGSLPRNLRAVGLTLNASQIASHLSEYLALRTTTVLQDIYDRHLTDIKNVKVASNYYY
jgi:hypothetical protein